MSDQVASCSSYGTISFPAFPPLHNPASSQMSNLGPKNAAGEAGRLQLGNTTSGQPQKVVYEFSEPDLASPSPPHTFSKTNLELQSKFRVIPTLQSAAQRAFSQLRY